jgi:intracellular sulfur oxidation DsrE/DsrF family protein
MKSRILLLTAVFAALVTAALTSAVVAHAQQNPAPAKHRVVFQMNMPSESWNQLLGNVGNIQKAFGADGVQIEIVFYGKGLTALLKTNKDYEERLKKLAADGVILGACQNSMRIMKVTGDDIFPFSTQVDSGVAELVRKQEAGWTYIRAGE